MTDPRASPTSSSSAHRRILERVARIPPGYVRSYGDVWPAAPRLTGRVLSGAVDESLPWHRVVRADGSLPQGERQRRLLRAEGVPFRGTRVAMERARLDDLDAG